MALAMIAPTPGEFEGFWAGLSGGGFAPWSSSGRPIPEFPNESVGVDGDSLAASGGGGLGEFGSGSGGEPIAWCSVDVMAGRLT